MAVDETDRNAVDSFSFKKYDHQIDSPLRSRPGGQSGEQTQPAKITVINKNAITFENDFNKTFEEAGSGVRASGEFAMAGEAMD